jgi:hypothetical protein
MGTSGARRNINVVRKLAAEALGTFALVFARNGRHQLAQKLIEQRRPAGWDDFILPGELVQNHRLCCLISRFHRPRS